MVLGLTSHVSRHDVSNTRIKNGGRIDIKIREFLKKYKKHPNKKNGTLSVSARKP
jgi:hypothetical protein